MCIGVWESEKRIDNRTEGDRDNDKDKFIKDKALQNDHQYFTSWLKVKGHLMLLLNNHRIYKL